MAKRKASDKAGSGKHVEIGVGKLRKSIERLDRDILEAINDRARLAQRLGEMRRAKGKDVYEPVAEQQALDRLVARNKGPLPDPAVRNVFRELAGGCRSLSHRLQVAYLGPAFSYSHVAAIERFGQQAELVPVTSIAAVFEEVDHRHVDLGLVPIENSTDGRIVDTLGMFARLPVRVCGEVQMRIHHNLLGRCRRSEVSEVYSKPQAISQCRDWLARHLPGVRIVETASTTAAAQLAVEKESAAAIASVQAGVNYRLDVLAADIEDNKNNITRFAVIGHHSGRRTGNDKTSLMLELPHVPGALADTMAVFKRHGLNLTWIESFPMIEVENEYLFFVELEGHQTDVPVRRAIAALEKKTAQLDILGSYAKSPPND